MSVPRDGKFESSHDSHDQTLFGEVSRSYLFVVPSFSRFVEFHIEAPVAISTSHILLLFGGYEPGFKARCNKVEVFDAL